MATTKPDIQVVKCPCGSSLFLDSGLGMFFTALNIGESYKRLHICAMCQSPYFLDAGILRDASDWISDDLLAGAWTTLCLLYKDSIWHDARHR